MISLTPFCMSFKERACFLNFVDAWTFGLQVAVLLPRIQFSELSDDTTEYGESRECCFSTCGSHHSSTRTRDQEDGNDAPKSIRGDEVCGCGCE